MSIDPSAALQIAVYSTLTTDAGIAAVMPAVVVYDRVPPNPQYPFIKIGDDQIIGDDGYQDSNTTTAHVVVNVYSQYKGKLEVKRIGGAVASALRAYLPIDGFRVVTYEMSEIRYYTDPDCLTEHAVIEAEYIIAALN